MSRSRQRAAAIPLALVVAATTGCRELLVADPAPASAASIAASFTVVAAADSAGIAEAFASSDTLHLRIMRGAATALDTLLSISPGATEARVRLAIELENGSEQLEVRFELRGAGIPLFAGRQDVQLTRGATTSVTVPIEPVTDLLEPALAVASGQALTCALSQLGLTYCWGRQNRFFSPTRTAPRTTPGLVAFWPRFAQITVGVDHVCGLTREGDAWCWGWNVMGQLGDGTTIDRAVPVEVMGEIPFELIDAGPYHTCGLTIGGQAYCWGGNGRMLVDDAGGPLGYDPPENCPVGDAYFGDVRCSTVPRPVNGGLSFTQLSGGAMHSCGVTTARVGYCWGWNLQSQVGVGPDTTFGFRDPQRVAHGGSFQSIHAGPVFSCGLDVTGAAHCWGNMARGTSVVWDWGQFGDGKFDGNARPEPVTGGLSFRALALPDANSIHAGFACGLTPGDAAWCWGMNDQGQLGAAGGQACTDGTNLYDCRNTPAPVTGGLRFASLSLGENHACGITTIGELYCWGGNENAQLGDGTTTDRGAPARVSVPLTTAPATASLPR